jgi:hypothetical protein
MRIISNSYRRSQQFNVIITESSGLESAEEMVATVAADFQKMEEQLHHGIRFGEAMNNRALASTLTVAHRSFLYVKGVFVLMPNTYANDICGGIGR